MADKFVIGIDPASLGSDVAVYRIISTPRQIGKSWAELLFFKNFGRIPTDEPMHFWGKSLLPAMSDIQAEDVFPDVPLSERGFGV